ncbi:MAG: hypothetical protein GTN78_06895, partial [Gemmatimonadales bacterium]|nr:hypothetical protein [Gemmatimonadales bacterium]
KIVPIQCLAELASFVEFTLNVAGERGVPTREGILMAADMHKVADDIDRLITLDMNRRGVIRPLYEAARERIGRPLVLAAAEELAGAVDPGD